MHLGIQKAARYSIISDVNHEAKGNKIVNLCQLHPDVILKTPLFITIHPSRPQPESQEWTHQRKERPKAATPWRRCGTFDE